MPHEDIDIASTHDSRPIALDPAVIAALRELQVDGEPDVVELFAQVFIADTEARLPSVRVAAAHRNAATFAREAHALKGGSSSVGAAAMAEICGQMQAMGDGGDLAGALPAVALLEAEWLRVRAALEAEVSAQIVVGGVS